MHVLLRLKHWQIFLLIVGIPLVIQFIQNVWIIASRQETEPSYPSFLGLLLIIPLLIYFLWIGEVGKKYSKSKKSPPMNTRNFMVSLWVSCLSNIFLLVYFWSYPKNLDVEGEEVIPITLIALLVFIALLTLFHCLSFMAKAIVQLERGREITSSEFFSEFVMAVLLPIGIWLLQPRINQLAKEKNLST